MKIPFEKRTAQRTFFLPRQHKNYVCSFYRSQLRNIFLNCNVLRKMFNYKFLFPPLYTRIYETLEENFICGEQFGIKLNRLLIFLWFNYSYKTLKQLLSFRKSHKLVFPSKLQREIKGDFLTFLIIIFMLYLFFVDVFFSLNLSFFGIAFR